MCIVVDNPLPILVDNLSFSYGDKRILNKLHLSVAAGENVGIMGMSGSGKSTLLKLISGLYEVQSGTIQIGSFSTAMERRRLVAVVMQSAMLFPASIRENISCGHPISDDVLQDACEAAQLTSWIATLPDGLSTFVGEQGSKVSGGQAQRIAIARAIAKDTPVILLDEPTSALDGETSEAFIAALMNLTRGKTVLHISHRAETLTGCHRILQLKEGEI